MYLTTVPTATALNLTSCDACRRSPGHIQHFTHIPSSHRHQTSPFHLYTPRAALSGVAADVNIVLKPENGFHNRVGRDPVDEYDVPFKTSSLHQRTS